MVWYKKHEAELRAERPELIPTELTKYAMNKYKTLYPLKGGAEPSNGDTEKSKNVPISKRKIDLDEAKGQSGIAKLAKFQFSK